MNFYESFLYRDNEKIEDDFLSSRKDFLKQSVEDRRLMISLRKEVHARNESQIGEELADKLHRLTFLSMSYSAERVATMNHISRLLGEARSERVKVINDVSRMSREMMTELEKYEEMKGLSAPMPIRNRGEDFEL